MRCGNTPVSYFGEGATGVSVAPGCQAVHVPRLGSRSFIAPVLVVLAALVLLATPRAAPAQSAESDFKACPGTFHVLHADRVGALRLSAGMHDLAVSGDVTCAQAPKLLAGFLQDWDGRLASPWKVVAADGEFLRGTTGDGIRISAANAPPTPGPSTGDACPYFTVLDDDRIGNLTLKAGRYTMRLLSRSQTCAQAAREFHDFLYDTNGLPFPWRAEATVVNDVTFRRGSTSSYGFRVRRKFAATPGGGRYPAAGQLRCPGTFLVQNPNRIGKLEVAKGMHWITVFGGVTCKQAIDGFKVFLGRPAGDLPSPWRLRAATASFVRGTQGTRGFWIDRAHES
jgi:hypothetical protein